jgi:hypothetical protein
MINEFQVSSIAPNDSIDLSPAELFEISSLHFKDSHFYMVGYRSKIVAKADSSLKQILRLSASGRGPYEFTNPYSLAITDSGVYVADSDQRKIIYYSLGLVPLDEFRFEEPILSLSSSNTSDLLIGTLNMEYEDVYRVDFKTKKSRLDGNSFKTSNPMEGIVYHSHNDLGDLLRFRQYHHRLDLYRADGTHITFSNPTRPERPDENKSIPGYPVFTSTTHNSAFLTADRACVLSGDHTPGNQPVQCFDFSGQLVARYSLKQDPSMISVYTDSTLYTYSPKTNHIYVYNLGF